jgi:hypothetical protein
LVMARTSACGVAAADGKGAGEIWELGVIVVEQGTPGAAAS